MGLYMNNIMRFVTDSSFEDKLNIYSRDKPRWQGDISFAAEAPPPIIRVIIFLYQTIFDIRLSNDYEV